MRQMRRYSVVAQVHTSIPQAWGRVSADVTSQPALLARLEERASERDGSGTLRLDSSWIRVPHRLTTSQPRMPSLRVNNTLRHLVSISAAVCWATTDPLSNFKQGWQEGGDGHLPILRFQTCTSPHTHPRQHGLFLFLSILSGGHRQLQRRQPCECVFPRSSANSTWQLVGR